MTANITPYPESGLFNGNYDRSHTCTIPSRIRGSYPGRPRGTNPGKKRCKSCSMSLCNFRSNYRYNRSDIPSELLPPLSQWQVRRPVR